MRAVLVTFWTSMIACTPMSSDDPSDSGSLDEVPTRRVFGRVHKTEDANIGLGGVAVACCGVETVSDALGSYSLDIPVTGIHLRVDAVDDGYAPMVGLLPPTADDLEFWPGLLPLDDVEEVLGVMSVGSDVAPELRDDVAYLVFDVQYHDRRDAEVGTEVSVLVDDQPAAHQYGLVFNDLLGECLPVRFDDGTVVTDDACDGIVLVPELPAGAEIEIRVTHPDRRCAATVEDRLAGLAVDELVLRRTVAPGALNVLGAECTLDD